MPKIFTETGHGLTDLAFDATVLRAFSMLLTSNWTH